jgi:hypothetical protein
METIHGPIAQLVAGNVIYQVTLASGMIVTRPMGFGDGKPAETAPVIVSEGGRVLAGPRATPEA